MNPLQPQDAFGTTHVAALLLLGIDAMANDVLAMTNGGSAEAFAEPDDFDFALVGLCVLGSRIRGFADSAPQAAPNGDAIWLRDNERVLR